MLGSSGGRSSGDPYEPLKSYEPNKFNFNIMLIMNGQSYDMIYVNYPDCTTFNGDKLLVVNKDSVDGKTTNLDPHFFEDGIIVARFPPTDEGFNLAKLIIGEI
tara:strand:+ start:158 stop:466 length:309 start_codon:yes stop_codon:yes gene_type:complete